MTSSLYTSMASFSKHIRYLPFGYETVIKGYRESKINAGPVWAAWDSTFVKWCVGYERGKLKVRVFVTFARTVGICRYGWLLRRTFCSGNVWFFELCFRRGDSVTSKTRQGTKLQVHQWCFGESPEVVCARPVCWDCVLCFA